MLMSPEGQTFFNADWKIQLSCRSSLTSLVYCEVLLGIAGMAHVQEFLLSSNLYRCVFLSKWKAITLRSWEDLGLVKKSLSLDLLADYLYPMPDEPFFCKNLPITQGSRAGEYQEIENVHDCTTNVSILPWYSIAFENNLLALTVLERLFLDQRECFHGHISFQFSCILSSIL